jgi:hypothetical protein
VRARPRLREKSFLPLAGLGAHVGKLLMTIQADRGEVLAACLRDGEGVFVPDA